MSRPKGSKNKVKTEENLAAKWMQENGFKLNYDNKNSLVVDLNLACVQKLLKADRAFLGTLKNPPTDDLVRGDNNWVGGTLKNLEDSVLNGVFDLNEFQTVKDRITRSSAFGKLASGLDAKSPRRRRVMSEYDGEWDYGRRWDLKPYQSFSRSPVASRSIDLTAHCVFSSWTNAEQINAYGALVWSVVRALEERQIAVKLTLVYESMRQSICNRDMVCKYNLLVKDFGEYLSEQVIASTLVSNFFRRAMFAVWDLSLSAINHEMAPSKGSGPDEFTVKASPGKLTLGAKYHGALDAEVFGKILEIL